MGQMSTGGGAHLVKFSGGSVGTLGAYPLSLSVVPLRHRLGAQAAVCLELPRRTDHAPACNRATEVIWLNASQARELAHALTRCEWAATQLNQPAAAQSERQALDSAIGELVSGFGDLRP